LGKKNRRKRNENSRHLYFKTRNHQIIAAWIAEELRAELLKAGSVSPPKLREFDCLVYGGGLYVGGILGANRVAKNQYKNLVVVTVGLADPQNTDYTRIL
jgi:hypothetical protein